MDSGATQKRRVGDAWGAREEKVLLGGSWPGSEASRRTAIPPAPRQPSRQLRRHQINVQPSRASELDVHVLMC